MKSKGYRSSSDIPETRCNFIFSMGGLGDYIHWTPALLYYKEKYPFVKGDVFVPPFFRELAELWIEGDGWKIWDRMDLKKKTRFHENAMWGMRGSYINALGSHLYDLGFLYMLNRRVPKDHTPILPKITGNEKDISHFGLPEDYVVITTGATEETRALPASTINDIAKGVLDRGMTPVFVGKRVVTSDHVALFPYDVQWDLGIDLRERTSVLEAACVLAGAKAVLGLDNGLLHLASCSDVPVIFGFTNVNPELRVPPRSPSSLTKVIAPPENLECRFCMSEMRGLAGLTSKKCPYNDYACIDTLTPTLFLNALDDTIMP